MSNIKSNEAHYRFKTVWGGKWKYGVGAGGDFRCSDSETPLIDLDTNTMNRFACIHDTDYTSVYECDIVRGHYNGEDIFGMVVILTDGPMLQTEKEKYIPLNDLDAFFVVGNLVDDSDTYLDILVDLGILEQISGHEPKQKAYTHKFETKDAMELSEYVEREEGALSYFEKSVLNELARISDTIGQILVRIREL